jgi:hypothetical protein
MKRQDEQDLQDKIMTRLSCKSCSSCPKKAHISLPSCFGKLLEIMKKMLDNRGAGGSTKGRVKTRSKRGDFSAAILANVPKFRKKEAQSKPISAFLVLSFSFG